MDFLKDIAPWFFGLWFVTIRITSYNVCYTKLLRRIMDKDAFDWYQAAQQNYEKGYLIDAVNDLVLANQLLKPANQFWQYQKEKEIQEFGQKVMADINNKFTFPMTVDYVKTKPQIFNIYPQGMNEGYFPMIRYTTSIDLSDTITLRKECDEIHSKIGDLYYGIDNVITSYSIHYTKLYECIYKIGEIAVNSRVVFRFNSSTA